MRSETLSTDQLTFGAFFAYAPRGTSEASRRGLQVRDHIKKSNPEFLERTAARIAQSHTVELPGIFGPDVTLVPAPRSYPLQKGWLWPAERIARGLLNVGLAEDIEPYLAREAAVAKAATASASERPTIDQHCNSLSVDRRLHTPKRILIIDDVITRGTMAYACARMLREAYPSADIQVFALLRTMSWLTDVDTHISPFVGKIVPSRWSDDYTDRSDYLASRK